MPGCTGGGFRESTIGRRIRSRSPRAPERRRRSLAVDESDGVSRQIAAEAPVTPEPSSERRRRSEPVRGVGGPSEPAPWRISRARSRRTSGDFSNRRTGDVRARRQEDRERERHREAQRSRARRAGSSSPLLARRGDHLGRGRLARRERRRQRIAARQRRRDLRAEAGRCRGSFSRQRRITRSTAGSSPGHETRTGAVGGSSACLRR